jgi:hypothetical protein
MMDSYPPAVGTLGESIFLPAYPLLSRSHFTYSSLRIPPGFYRFVEAM